MIIRNVFILLLFLAGFQACKQERKEESSAGKMEEVMAIHDEVMPKMSTIAKLVGELKPKVDSTESGQRYAAAMQDLQEAHESMMLWMQDFGSRFDSEEIMEGKALSNEKLQWLEEEEEKVKEVRDKINNSIARAEAVLNE